MKCCSKWNSLDSQNQIHVNLQLEISPHHQDIVKGKNNSQLLSIMERTKTKVSTKNTLEH